MSCPRRKAKVAAKARTDKRTWLVERGYRVLAVDARTIEADVAQVLDRSGAGAR